MHLVKAVGSRLGFGHNHFRSRARSVRIIWRMREEWLALALLSFGICVFKISTISPFHRVRTCYSCFLVLWWRRWWCSFHNDKNWCMGEVYEWCRNYKKKKQKNKITSCLNFSCRGWNLIKHLFRCGYPWRVFRAEIMISVWDTCPLPRSWGENVGVAKANEEGSESWETIGYQECDVGLILLGCASDGEWA